MVDRMELRTDFIRRKVITSENNGKFLYEKESIKKLLAVS
jgi:hypothetical protein